MGGEKGRKGEREDVSTSGYSIFVDVVSFVINVYNFTPDYHGYKNTNSMKEECSSYTQTMHGE